MPQNCVVFYLLGQPTQSAILCCQKFDFDKMADCVSSLSKREHSISRLICVDHYILLLKHLSIRINFPRNALYSLNCPNLKQRVPLNQNIQCILSQLVIFRSVSNKTIK